MSPSLPLFPEPMVNMWPSSSLQAPTSEAFLGMVGFAPLPWPPWPWPALQLFPLHPPWPALGVQAIFLCLRGPYRRSDGGILEKPLGFTILGLVGPCLVSHGLGQLHTFVRFTKTHGPLPLANLDHRRLFSCAQWFLCTLARLPIITNE